MADRPLYDVSVFINCPFDREYRRLLDALVFTVYECGCVARSALEVTDSGQIRIEKIARLIGQCRLGVHDLCRTEIDQATSLPRFNMPLELGVFLGAKWFGGKEQKRKGALVLDSDRYRYRALCSDISGQDVAAHENDPAIVIREIRNWLSSHRRDVRMPSGTVMAKRYQQFVFDLPTICRRLKLDPHELTFLDLTTVVEDWLRLNT